MVTLTHVGTSVYLGQTHLGTPFQVPAWVRKFSLGSTDEISSLIIIQSLFVQQKFEYTCSPLLVSAEMIKWLQVSWFQHFRDNVFFRFLLLICLKSAVK